MQSRFILFIVLSVGILFFSNYLFTSKQKQPQNYQKIESPVQEAEQPQSKKAEAEIEEKKETGKIPRKTTEIETRNIIVRASNVGGTITDIIIKKFEQNKQEINILSTGNNEKYFNLTVVLNDEKYDLKNREWQMRGGKDYVRFTNDPINNFSIHKTLEINEGQYTGKIGLEFDNHTENIIEIKNPTIQWGPNSKNTDSRFNILQAVIFNKEKTIRINAKKKSSTQEINIENGWAGIKDQYFCAIFYSPNHLIKSAIVDQYPDNTLELDVVLPDFKISPNERKKYEIFCYFGPQNYQLLKKTGFHLNKIVYFGIFNFIGVWMLFTLKFFYSITKNYGLAIILLTLLIRVILWWPTQKSYTSMKKMQSAMNKMQPRLKTLKEVYKDNPQKLNEETMKLYKEYQINPMGGCLPMLLQLPIFFALYSTLTNAVELKGASFFWVWKDLSVKDPAYILPIAMGVTMFIQQKISSPPAATPEAAAQQKMMLYLMPVMLTFFAFMWPSGLLLYWVMSNIMSIAQQVLINRRA